MKDEIVTLETAKAAKQKGFDWACHHLYSEKGVIGINHHRVDRMYVNHPEDTWNTAAPYQSLLRKWLRDVHGIQIEVLPIYEDHGRIYVGNVGRKRYLHIRSSTTYEGVLEICLWEGLKLIQ